MRVTLLTLSLAGLAIAGDPARVTSPVLGYVFDSTSKSMRPIAGVPGAAAIEAAVPSASKIEIGFVSQNRRYLIASTLKGIILKPRNIGLTGTRIGSQRCERSPPGVLMERQSRSGAGQVSFSFGPVSPIRYLSFQHLRILHPDLRSLTGGRSVLVPERTRLYTADGSAARQLISEQVNSAAYRAGSEYWAASRARHARSNAEPLVLPVTKARSVAFTSKGVLIAGDEGNWSHR